MAQQFGLKYTTPELHKVSTQINFLHLNRNRLHTFNLEPFTARSSLAPALYLYWLFLLRPSRLTRGPTH